MTVAEKTTAPRRKDRGVRQYGFYLLGAAIAIGLWALITSGPDNKLSDFGPAGTISAWARLFTNPRFWAGVFETLKRLGGGLTIAALAGIPVGLLIGYSRVFREMSYVPSQILRMVSPLSWTPVAIIIFGIGGGPVYFLVAVAAVWPFILNTAAGVRAAEPQWIEVARVLGAGDRELLTQVLFRASLPHILVGLQLALGVAWIVIVPAEMLGVASGLGYMILDFRDVNDYSSVMALILTIGCLGLLLDWPTRLAVARASWH